MKKRALSALLTLCLLLGLLPATAFAADPPHSHPICGAACSGHDTSHGDETWTAWDGRTSLSNGNYYLTKDETFTYDLKITGTVNLCLNGHTLTGKNGTGAGYHGDLHLEGSDAALTICDCSTAQTGTFNGEASDYPIDNQNGTVNLYGGTIIGKKRECVIRGRGTVATFTITGNTRIISNDPGCAAVTCDDGNTLTVTEGVTITSTGTAISNGGNATISGGTISGGRYGVYMSNINATLKMIGSPSISGITADLFLYSNKADSSPDAANVDVTQYTGYTGDPLRVAEAGFRLYERNGACAIKVPEKDKDKFTLINEGYDYRYENGGLYLTAIAITQQPTKDTPTVGVSYAPEDIQYAWYPAQKKTEAVTDTNANAYVDEMPGAVPATFENGKWTAAQGPEAGYFTIDLKKGDEVTVTLDGAVGSSTELSLSKTDYSKTVALTFTNGQAVCTAAAPEDGKYFLAGLFDAPSISATVKHYVLGGAVAGQTTNTLTGMSSGAYVCKVSWPKGTVLISDPVVYSESPEHTHTWATVWSKNGTHHWHECTAEGCDIENYSTCNEIGAAYAAHEYTNGRDTDCNVCGYQRTVALSGVVSISGTEKIGETLTATVSGTPANVPLKYAWTVSGGDGTVLGTGLSYTPTTAGEVGRELTFTVSTEDPRYTGSLSASTDPVAKGDQAAPSRELFHVTDAEQGQSNGAIAVSGDAGALEYRAKPADGGDPAYTAAAARIENLAAGWYQFRYRETAVYTAGNVTELEVRSLTPAAKDLTIDGGIAHGSVTAVRSKVNPGDTVKLTVTPEAGYQLTAIAANYGGGQTVTPVWDEAVGAYTFTMPDAAVTVTAVFSAVRPPEGGDSSSDDDDDRDSPSAGGRPSVSVSGKGGAVTADRDGSVTVTPDKGYVIDRVTVNGKEVNVPEDGKLTGLKRTDKVTVTFKEEAFEPSPVTVDRFTDVKSGDWFYAGVKAAVEQELMNGVTEEAFAPHMTTDRAMIATILWRLEGEPKGAAVQDFPDVAEGQWYTEAIGWAAAKGVVTGYGGGSFGPLDPITREQFAVMLWRYAGSPAGTGTLAAFTDADRVSAWAADALCWAVEQGILTGRGGGVLDPTGQATRAEAAAMLMRYCQRTEK